MPTYSRLTHEQRYPIGAMNRNGSARNEIAKSIRKHPSTGSRGLRRLGACRDYCFVEAQRDADSKTNGGKRCDPGILERKLNRRPRECLDYRTPHDIFNSPPLVALVA